MVGGRWSVGPIQNQTGLHRRRLGNAWWVDDGPWVQFKIKPGCTGGGWVMLGGWTMVRGPNSKSNRVAPEAVGRRVNHPPLQRGLGGFFRCHPSRSEGSRCLSNFIQMSPNASLWVTNQKGTSPSPLGEGGAHRLAPLDHRQSKEHHPVASRLSRVILRSKATKNFCVHRCSSVVKHFFVFPD
ncbi:protein of unknown function [Nitrospina watsonii]|uniref:Uncharacterized protein n=1 Tax=Nitrospina watsonii TaxID=1323948 RepID=A0ABM9HFJ9_9BACT|nr:protein of unknown function [Nitrospina watsonii]